MITTACTSPQNDSVMSSTVRAKHELSELVTRSRVPGAQYVQVDASGVVFEHYVGWADTGASRPMSADTTMMAYSIGKTLTAVASRPRGAGRPANDRPGARRVVEPAGARPGSTHGPASQPSDDGRGQSPGMGRLGARLLPRAPLSLAQPLRPAPGRAAQRQYALDRRRRQPGQP